jgi:hypothetical protein
MKEFIISNYDGKSLAVYKGDCKRRFRQAVKTLNRVWERSVDEENWPLVIDNALKSKKSSGTTTTSNNSIVTEERKKAVIEKYSKIKESEKWTLSTGNVVDDVMKARVEEAVYEHPVHSLIFDLSDPL